MFSVQKIATNQLAEVRSVHLRLFVARVASLVADQGTSEVQDVVSFAGNLKRRLFIIQPLQLVVLVWHWELYVCVILVVGILLGPWSVLPLVNDKKIIEKLVKQ